MHPYSLLVDSHSFVFRVIISTLWSIAAFSVTVVEHINIMEHVIIQCQIGAPTPDIATIRVLAMAVTKPMNEEIRDTGGG